MRPAADCQEDKDRDNGRGSFWGRGRGERGGKDLVYHLSFYKGEREGRKSCSSPLPPYLCLLRSSSILVPPSVPPSPPWILSFLLPSSFSLIGNVKDDPLPPLFSEVVVVHAFLSLQKGFSVNLCLPWRDHLVCLIGEFNLFIHAGMEGRVVSLCASWSCMYLPPPSWYVLTYTRADCNVLPTVLISYIHCPRALGCASS